MGVEAIPEHIRCDGNGRAPPHFSRGKSKRGALFCGNSPSKNACGLCSGVIAMPCPIAAAAVS
jgi:hypothetical protein